MMYWISQQSGEKLSMNQLQHCLMRNFGGKTDVNATVQLFLGKLQANLFQTTQSTTEVEVSICSYRCLPVYFMQLPF